MACHIRATSHGDQESSAVTHGSNPAVTRAEVDTGRQPRALPIFQAGHEGSIPFVRSNPKPQVSATTDVSATKIMMLARACVPAACPIELGPLLPGAR
jgi:hypothetical protein